MAKYDHGSTAIADSYAGTLLGLAEEAKNADTVITEFEDFVSFMEKDAVFGDFMTNPAVDADDRAAVLEKHFRGKYSDLLVNTLQVVNKKGRGELLPLIYERFRLKLEEVRNEVDVHVTSAVELNDALRDKVRHAAAGVAGRTPRLVEEVDPGILGGLVVRIGDKKLDSSVVNRLHQFRETLDERASREIHSGKAFFEAVEQ
jgi:F-type H+-transporting ATPase subunit delta